MKAELVLNQASLTAAFLDAAIEKVQKQIVWLAKTGTEVDPQYALTELQSALNGASKLAHELSPKNFVVHEILNQRRAIRKELRKEVCP